MNIRDPKIAIPITIVAIAVVGFLAFGVFGIHTLFVDEVVDEAEPEFDLSTDDIDEEMAEEMAEVMEEEGVPVEVVAAEEMPEMEEEENEVVVELMGDFVPRGHGVEGFAEVLGNGTGQRFLRFEDFETDNGPDLNVYLAKSDASADEGTFDDDAIDLGDLKGNIGSQNYEIPADVDLEVHDTVVIWCVRFSVAFAAADLA